MKEHAGGTGGAVRSWTASPGFTQAREEAENASHVPHHRMCPLSPEITRTIFSYLDANERLRMAQVCPTWAAIIDETWMWTDDEVRLRLSAYTTYFSPLHQRGISMVRVEELQLPFGTLPRLLQALPDIKSLNLSYCVRLSNDVIRRAFSASMWTSLAVLNLSCCPYVSDIGMECVTSTLPNLEQLHINGCYRIRSLSMALIASRLRKLKLIEMNKCRIGNKGLRLLSGLSVPEERLDEEAMPKLEHISIRSSTFVTHSGLLFIGQRMQHLKTLDIAMCSSVQDRAISEIARMATLKHLDLHGCNKLTARSIEYLSTGPLSLAYLDISYCPQIGDDALEKVFEGPGLWSLTTLHMASTSITDYGLTIVALTLERLTTLDVSSCEAISERGIETVSTHIGNLRYLYLRFCRRLHNDSFINPTCMANLKVVSLKGCRRIGSPGMEALASGGVFANLLELDVGFTSVDDIGLKYIAQAAMKLRVLGLSGCGVSDEGIALISLSLPSLHTLKLSRCHRLTERGIDAAACNHRNLTHISLKGCPNITKAWKEKMVAQRPNLILT